MPTLIYGSRPHDGELSCRELVELVTDYLEGVLPTREHARFESHVPGCEHCTEYVLQMRHVVGLLCQLTPETPSPEAKANLRAVFRRWRSGM